MSTAPTPNGAQIGTAAPNAALTDTDGHPAALSDFWNRGPVVLVFLRHFGCTFCREQVSELRRDYARFQSLGLEVLCVAQGDPQTGKAFSIFFDLPFPLLVTGTDLAVYRAYGLQRGTLGQLFGLHSLTRGLRATLRGHWIGRLIGDGHQMPGVFIVDRQGMIRYAHRHASAADNPDTRELLRAAQSLDKEPTMRPTATTITAGLIACLAFAGMGTSPAAPPKAPKAGAKTSADLVTQGKALAAADRCNTCHGATYAGKQGFSPSLHADGVLREYTPATWAVVMDTGVTNDGGHVKQPMPVYHLKPAQSNALYAYFKTLK